MSAAVARYEDMLGGGNSELNGVEAACERHLQIQAEIESMKNDLAAVKSRLAKIDAALKVNDDVVRKMIEVYYMDGFSWEQISLTYHYSQRWCREKTKKAVKDMAAVIFGIKTCPGQLSLVFAQ